MNPCYSFLAAVLGLALVRGKPSVAAAGTLPFPLKHHGDEYSIYTLDVTIGAQRFNLTLDMDALTSVVLAKGFSAANTYCTTPSSQRNLFDSSRSPSFNFVNASIDGPLLDEHPYVGIECRQNRDQYTDRVSGEWATDTLALGSVSVTNAPFFLANHTRHQLNPQWASDGVLALSGYSYAREDATKKILNAIGEKQEITLFVSKQDFTGSAGVSQLPSVITFGGKDTQNCDSQLSYLTNDRYADDWSVPLGRVMVGSENIIGLESGKMARISVSSPLLEAPTAHFGAIIRALGAQYNFELDRFTVDCNEVENLPEITIQVYLDDGPTEYFPVWPNNFVAKK
ncbi:Protein ASP-1 protein5, partial [Aphelenchoides avenae]